MLQTLKHHLFIWGLQIKNNWIREFIYRSNFITMMIVDLIWNLVELALFSIIYSHVDNLAGWTKPQTFFFLGIFFTSDALFTTFFQRNFWAFSDLVNKGELDTLLIKPASAPFLALTRWVNTTGIFNLISGLTIVTLYANAAGFAGGWHWLLVPLWVLFGVLAQVCLRFIFSVWIFWTDRGFALSHLYYQFFQFATKPDAIYPNVIRYILMSALPFAFIGSVPARALINGLSFLESLTLVAVMSFFIIASVMLWSRGLKRYQSASS